MEDGGLRCLYAGWLYDIFGQCLDQPGERRVRSPHVEVKAGNRRVSCRRRLVTEERLRIQVLQLRDSPPLLGRVVFEMSPVGE